MFKKNLFLMIIFCSLSIIACDDGTKSVDFIHEVNATDAKTINFRAIGKSDFGKFEFSWNFGDGKTSTGKEVAHRFEKFGKYTITLTATIDKSNIATQIQKEVEIEVPIISNIQIKGKASSKSANMIEYVVSSISDYDNEIEYTWQFDDASTATGQIITRTISNWPSGDNFGNITDKVIISAYIPSLDYTYRNNEPYNVIIEKPKINNFNINCTNEGTAGFSIFNCDVRKNGIKPTATVGKLNYEWFFNGEVRNGDIQTFTLSQANYDYPVYVTATIDGTNISETRMATINYVISEKDINFNCSTAIVNDNHEDALIIKCQPQYNKAKIFNPTIFWEMGDDKLIVESHGNEIIKYKYDKAGIYDITMEFKSENYPKPIIISKKQTVLVNLATWSNTHKDNNVGTHICKDGKYVAYQTSKTFNNNFKSFRQKDFDLYSNYYSGNFKCKGQSGGWNMKEINVWYNDNTHMGKHWDDWNQNGNFVLCPKGESQNSSKCIKSSF